MLISAWWLRISSKFSGKKSKKQPQTQKWTLLCECGFVQTLAPPSLSRDRRIKMEKQTSPDSEPYIGINIDNTSWRQGAKMCRTKMLQSILL